MAKYDYSRDSHGHVRPRPDGRVAPCGGPLVCVICQAELRWLAEQTPQEATAEARARKAARTIVTFLNAGSSPFHESRVAAIIAAVIRDAERNAAERTRAACRQAVQEADPGEDGLGTLALHEVVQAIESLPLPASSLPVKDGSPSLYGYSYA